MSKDGILTIMLMVVLSIGFIVGVTVSRDRKLLDKSHCSAVVLSSNTNTVQINAQEGYTLYSCKEEK